MKYIKNTINKLKVQIMALNNERVNAIKLNNKKKASDIEAIQIELDKQIAQLEGLAHR
tara:strand:- start:285 stop:458 length:174 start_codon:yes stop_codon:yes gene_type:complete